MKYPLVTLAVITLILAGCSVPDDPTPVVTHTEVSTPAPSVTPEEVDAEPVLSDEQLEQVYLLTLREQNPELTAVSDDMIVRLGHQVCETLDAGASFDQMAAALLGQGNDELAGAVVGAAVSAFCPEYTADMNAFIDANS
jgi:hypothetical protein